MPYWIPLFVLVFVRSLSSCASEAHCVADPSEAGRACYEEQQREAEDCERRRPSYEEEQAPDYIRY